MSFIQRYLLGYESLFQRLQEHWTEGLVGVCEIPGDLKESFWVFKKDDQKHMAKAKPKTFSRQKKNIFPLNKFAYVKA